MQHLERRGFLLGSLGGVGIGAAAGLGAAYLADPRTAQHQPGLVEFTDYQVPSFAQQGEDLIVANVFKFLQIPLPTYIDIGAFEPIRSNNTYLLYKEGCRGVLVEPNPAFTSKLRRTRPQDTVLEIGIGAKGEDEDADFYIIDGDGQGNTFSLEQAKRLQALLGERVLKQVIKRKLVNINKVLEANFGPGGPDLFSSDTEGYDLTILETLDFERFRPRVFCVETLFGLEAEPRILDLMRSKDYEVRGGTFVNTVFIDNRYLGKLSKTAGAGSSSAATPSLTGL
jgi:FkbM family methyltransferase